MTKDIILSISGMQTGQEDEDTVDFITSGTYYNKQGKHYIVYEEIDEESQQKTKSIIKIDDDCIEINKSGYISSKMLFETDRENLCSYGTAFGELLVGIVTNNISLKQTDKNIDVNIDYSLTINGEFVSDCDISMNIKAIK